MGIDVQNLGFRETPAYHLGDSVEEAIEIAKQHDLQDYAINTFIHCDNRGSKELSTYSRRIEKLAQNSETSLKTLDRLRSQLPHINASGSVNWGGNLPEVQDIKEGLLSVIDTIEKDNELPEEERRYKIEVPAHLKDCLHIGRASIATATGDHFNLDLEAANQALSLCNLLFESSNSSLEDDRLVMNNKANKTRSMEELLMSLINAIESARSKIIQASAR